MVRVKHLTFLPLRPHSHSHSCLPSCDKSAVPFISERIIQCTIVSICIQYPPCLLVLLRFQLFLGRKQSTFFRNCLKPGERFNLLAQLFLKLQF